MAKARSEYIKSLMEDKDNLEKQLQDVAHSTIESILNETISKNLRDIISEDDKKDDDSFTEEDVDDQGNDVTDDEPKDDVTSDEPKTDDAAEDAPVGDEPKDDELPADTEGDDLAADMEDGDEPVDDEDDVWGDYEQYKDEDGEYDLTGMDKDSLIKVLRVMKPEDGVRVLQNDNGTITLSDDETDKEYVIDLDGACGTDDDTDDEDTGIDLDLDLESIEHECNEDANLGYTDNYQNKTAMTTPSNNEPADSRKTYSMDGGIPTGTEKPFAGKGSSDPYGVNENEDECVGSECDAPMEEGVHSVTQNSAVARDNTIVHTPDTSRTAKGRNSRIAGKHVHGTADNSYSDVQVESIKRKATEIFNENKQLKALLPKMKSQLEEAIVLVHTYGNIIKLLNENSTTSAEKKEIVNRFAEVKSREESNKLYKTITEEFKRSHKTLTDINGSMNVQLTENKSKANDKPMYESTEISRQLDLIKRMENLYKN
jgi:hypothetical protein